MDMIEFLIFLVFFCVPACLFVIMIFSEIFNAIISSIKYMLMSKAEREMEDKRLRAEEIAQIHDEDFEHRRKIYADRIEYVSKYEKQ